MFQDLPLMSFSLSHHGVGVVIKEKTAVLMPVSTHSPLSPAALQALITWGIALSLFIKGGSQEHGNRGEDLKGLCRTSH